VVCVRCGAAANAAFQSGGTEQRDWLTMVLLCFFFGVFGVHRFYTGHKSIGIIQLLTAGGCGIWWAVDFLMILLGSYRDADGRPLAR
jgi:TM2 domain-containing membrane protein YozV